MANLSISENLRFLLNGVQVNAPVEWQDIELLANFDNDSIQANITTESFTFVNEARQLILEYIANGGIFEGLPFKIEAFSTVNTLAIFEGYLDLTSDFKDHPDLQKCECRIIKGDGLNSLEERLEAVTYGFLKEKGLITSADYREVTYVVIKPDQSLEIAIASITAYMLIKEIREQIREIGKDAAAAAGIFAAGATGSLGSAIYKIAVLILEVAYTSLMIVAIANLVATVINALFPIRRKHKCMSLRTLLEKAFAYAGYGFASDIKELEYYTYLPSNPNFDSAGLLSALTVGRVTEGIPNSIDYGYRVIELIELCKKLFKAKYAVVNGVVQFRWKGSPYWLKTATYELPSVIIEEYRYNTEEFKANTVLAFDTDASDEWTLENFTGTNYQVVADLIASRSAESKLTKGLEEVRFPIALGARKDKATALEKLLQVLTGFLKQVKQVFGQYAPDISAITTDGVLKVSSNNHLKPKLIYLAGGSIPENHRDLLSAKYLYNNFHYYDSFVSDNFRGQKVVYENVRMPFGLADFVKLAENSYFSTGEKATKVLWRLGSDYAVIDYWRRQVYTTNLSETFIEP